MYQRVMESMHLVAAFDLSEMFSIGEYIEKGEAHEKALKVFESAVDGGPLDAAFNLGIMYKSGNGVTKDIAKACKVFKVSARRGHLRSAFVVGKMYRDGDGVAQDYAKACKLLKRAAAAHQGDDMNLLLFD